ncbi:MAG: ribonuclease R [Sorangiineae bacterium]|nr:ribonuclease R [Polyangiaceae bacterium]MEB2321016.1 ribonuclease R [Sorangiineae bacterium]
MAQPLPSRGEIVGCLEAAGRPLHAREVAEACGVAEGSYPRLLELLDQLVFDRSVKRVGRRYLARPDDAQRGTWEGVLSVNPRGFGFVTAVGQDDVYVAPDGIGAALHGDQVRVAVIARTPRGVEGRIEEIVKRRSPRVAGVLRRRGKSAWLEPDDARLRGPITLGGARGGKDGDAAVATITRFPAYANENPEGELLAILGAPGEPNAEVAKILVREQIEEEHSEGAVREAEAMAARLQRLSLEGRVDLRGVPLPTIDPEDARDHDDAVWVERSGEGYRAYVAIADVSEYVQPGSALDEEAAARGCTIYLPDRAIPMLPAALAADLCSLLPERERLALCVIAELDKGGKVVRYELVEAVIRSAAMLTYGGVARALGFTEEPPRSPAAEAFKRDLKVLDELTRKLRRARMKRGALDLDLPEARVELDERTGAPKGVVRRARDPGVKRAYQMIEELMLLANELVAKWLSHRRAPTVYRVHGRPDEKKLERLGEVAEKLGVEFDLAELLEPAGVGKWLQRIEGHPRRAVLEMLLLRSLKQAVYDIVNIGHFGLASEAYLHFTSPIRRYPDIEVHRAVKRLLRGSKPDTSASAIESLRASATASSTRERAAADVEREVVDLYRALFMREHIGDTYEGTVTAVVGSGLFVSLDAPFVDVLVLYEAMGPDRYEITEDELGVAGLRSGELISLGDRIRVTIEDVAILRRTVYGRRVAPEAASPARARSGGKGRGRGRGEQAPPPRAPRSGTKPRRR